MEIYARVAWVTHWNSGQPDLAGEDFAQLAADEFQVGRFAMNA